MSKVKVLFFAADPHSAEASRLELAKDVRQIREKVGAAKYPDALDFDFHLAARPDDLLAALRKTRPQIVHFSGHGEAEGLLFIGPDGVRPHLVRGEALAQVFGHFRGEIRVVVLNACFSLPQAKAIAKAVGCAIGTRRKISDEAAITFGAAFYRAIASGESVQSAFDEAKLALAMQHFSERDCPDLAVRRGVDPSRVVLVAPPAPPAPATPTATLRSNRRWLVPHRAAAAAAAFVLTFLAIVTDVFARDVLPELTTSDIACSAQPTAPGIRPASESQGANSTTPATSVGAGAALANARALYQARNYSAAATAFEEAARDGSGEAMGCLGYMFLKGRGMSPQPATGIAWLRQAARQERDPHAMYALAMAYLSGEGVDQAEYLAEEWLLKAAQEKGYPEAMHALGNLYQQEMNDSSYQKAVTWYQKAIYAGSVDAKVDLGLMYEFGRGLRRDMVAALKLYRSAAQAGSAQGMLAVGQSYHKGVGGPRDYKKAMVWYRRAACAGSADAMNSIGVLYENGLGVWKSRGKAIRWYERAAQAGSKLAKGNLAELGRD